MTDYEPIQILKRQNEYESIEVWPRSNNKVTLCMESEDGECSFELTDAERKRLIKALSEA